MRRLVRRSSRARTGSEAIASIHETLYGSYDLTRIPFGSYAVELATSLHRGFVEGGSPAQLEVDVDDIELDIDTAIPLALILNELVTNAFRHGFPARGKASSRSASTSLPTAAWSSRSPTDGVGFPAGIDIEQAQSIGFQLVSMLAQQVGGIMELGRDGGICFTLTLGGTT